MIAPTEVLTMERNLRAASEHLCALTAAEADALAHDVAGLARMTLALNEMEYASRCLRASIRSLEARR